MNLYKYRSVENLERDLALYSRNCFWASTKDELNDENEFTFDAGPFLAELKVYEHLAHKSLAAGKSVSQVRQAANSLFNYSKTCGVFSLSESPQISKMWSLYASRGKGYCLIFDSNLLLKTVSDVIGEQRFLLSVKYDRKAPKIVFSDLINQNRLLTKMLATKNEEWRSESEVRIITDKTGVQPFIPSALIGVVFGTNTPEDMQNAILDAFKGREMRIYKLHKLEDTYQYFQEQLPAIHKEKTLDTKSYEFCNAPAPTVDNFYVKSKSTLSNKHAIIDFVNNFKRDKAERQCNIFLMDADTDLSVFKDYQSIDQYYVEQHLIAEMFLGDDYLNIVK